VTPESQIPELINAHRGIQFYDQLRKPFQKEAIMRMLMNVTLPADDFNQAVRDGSVGQKIARILEELKPEAVYFTEEDGERGVILIVNLDDASSPGSWRSVVPDLQCLRLVKDRHDP
jgi:hypothetical protein